MADLEAMIRQMSNENTAKTFAFNSSEAQKARNFEEQMSNTSHQREVADLKRAGINPVLSANGGASSYSASSASGSADTSSVGALAQIYQTKLNNDNARKIAEQQNKVNLQIAREQMSNQYSIERLGMQNAKNIAKINAAASNYASNNSYAASRYASDRNYSSSVYNTNVSSSTARKNTKTSLKNTKTGSIWTALNKAKKVLNNWSKTAKSKGD